METKIATPEILLNTQDFFFPHKVAHTRYEVPSETFWTKFIREASTGIRNTRERKER
jgi:hypothetical protein